MRSVPVMVTVTLAAVALTGGCASTPPEEDPVQIKLRELDARVARMERIVANQSLLELSQNQEAEQAELRTLQGRIEQLEHDNTALRKQEHDLYADLDKRVRAIAPGAGPAGGAAGAATDAAVGGAAGAGAGAAGGVGAGAATGAAEGAGSNEPSSVEQAVYTQAFEALKAGSYSIAITGFKDFLKSYPHSPLAENAQYWLGEAYYVNHDYGAAADAFRAVLRKWPDSRKAPAALLKLGYTQFEQKQYGAARATLTSVTQKYPDSDSARLATEKLKRIPAQ